MWLINTTTLELHEFADYYRRPPYAILSHCWGKGEVSFKNFQKKRDSSGPGYQKIVNACAYARGFVWEDDSNGLDYEGLDWLWVDTW